uniref:Putative secreted protein n=1 Tax=Ixodes ricinus TaxID=34613 RepID=A0A6B0UJ38_IXORI
MRTSLLLGSAIFSQKLAASSATASLWAELSWMGMLFSRSITIWGTWAVVSSSSAEERKCSTLWITSLEKRCLFRDRPGGIDTRRDTSSTRTFEVILSRYRKPVDLKASE